MSEINPSFDESGGAVAGDDDIVSSVVWINTTSGINPKVNFVALQEINVTQSTIEYFALFNGFPFTVTGDHEVTSRPLRLHQKVETVVSQDIDSGVSSLTPPTDGFFTICAYAEVHVIDDDGIVYTIDDGLAGPQGATATGPTTGFRHNAGATFELTSTAEIDNFRFNHISTTAGPGKGIYVNYYSFGDGSGNRD